MTDLISRRAALDALEWKWAGKAAMDAIKNLPSAQPYTEEEIQKIQDLEQAEIEKAFELGKEDALSEIVRCGECKRMNYYRFPPEYNTKPYCDKHGKVVDELDFCSWAERREE